MNWIEWHGRDRIDLGTQLLDRQITAPEAEPVGKVDDVELTRRPDGALEVTALLVGTSALCERVPQPTRWLLRLGMRLTGGPDSPRRIDLDDVVDVKSDVEVTAEAGEAAASPTERRFRAFVERIPGAGRAGS
ncbi:hypothetical protein [Glycomyces tenuis]|uniref:hypothetical protein n=1 Tax=Glycomyces tenuis TaxID=58116 RepID=UPI0004063A09|nr:hypothetical protein [Glycomyces tenuis]